MSESGAAGTRFLNLGYFDVPSRLCNVTKLKHHWSRQIEYLRNQIFWWKSDDRSEIGQAKGAQKWCFHVIPMSFWLCQNFEQVFLHPTLPSQPVSKKNPAHQVHPNYSLHVHLFSFVLSFTCLIFSCAIGVTLEISWSVPHHLPHWQSDGLEKWCHWWNGSQKRVVLKACKIAMFFRGTASGFGQHGHNFFRRGGSILFLFFFGGFWQYSSRSIQEWLFQDLIDFFEPAPKFWTFFSDKSSLLGNRLVPFERSTQFLPVPMVFGLLKKSLLVSINLLTLVVCNCTPEAGTRAVTHETRPDLKA